MLLFLRPQLERNSPECVPTSRNGRGARIEVWAEIERSESRVMRVGKRRRGSGGDRLRFAACLADQRQSRYRNRGPYEVAPADSFCLHGNGSASQAEWIDLPAGSQPKGTVLPGVGSSRELQSSPLHTFEA